jgi:hypothetical protein
MPGEFWEYLHHTVDLLLQMNNIEYHENKQGLTESAGPGGGPGRVCTSSARTGKS